MRFSEILSIRSALGLDAFAFSAILGVSVSTVYRWESLAKVRGGVRKGRGAEAPIHRLQSDLLTALRRTLAATPGIGRDLGQRISKALLAGGSLAGLRVLLDAITEEIPHG